MRTKHEHSLGVSEEAAFELGVVYSAVKDELVAFAAKEGNPYSFADVASRVAKLLQAEAVREQLRSPEHLPEMRQNGAGHHRGRPPKSGYYELAAEAALSAGAFADRALRPRLSAKARKAIGKAQRERWAKYHREQLRVKGSPAYERQRSAAKGKRDYAAEYWKRKAAAQTRTKMDGTVDGRFTAEARARQSAAMQKHYKNPKWRKAMLKRMAAMRARKNGKPVKRMSEETKAKLRAARFATIERKRAEGAA